MDPRHPEQATARMRELMKQYDRIEADMAKATTSAQLAQLEREGGLVVQEICLVAPRIHEAMMQTSRQRRHDLSRGIVDLGIRAQYEQPFEPVEKSEMGYRPEEKVGKYIKATIGIEEKPVEKPVEKSKKKTTRKKKTTKKAEK